MSEHIQGDAGRSPRGGATELERAEALEVELRVHVAELVTERRRATEEVVRLEQRAQLPGADAAITESAARYRTRIQALDQELEGARGRLRSQEGAVAALRADRDLGRAAPDQPRGTS